MFDWLPTGEVNTIIIGITVFLGLVLLGLILLYFEERQRQKSWRDTIPAHAARKPYKPLHMEV